jgi:putative ABC transport system permease protein
MAALNRKLWRELWRSRSQLVTIALVVACGIATYVTMRGTYESIELAQSQYYKQYRFADVFAQLKRAPESLATRIQEIPGTAAVQTRIVEEVTLDVPGLAEPVIGRLVSLPVRGRPQLNDIYLRRGALPEPGAKSEVLVSEAFAMANDLQPGDRLGAVINGRWEKLRVAGIALSPEYVYEIRGAEVFPDNQRFGVLWIRRDILGPAFQMEGAFNDVSLSLSPGANEAEVITQLDNLLEPYGGLGAYGRADQVSHRFLSDEIAQDRVTGIFIPSIFLGVAAFLIHIVLTRLVGTQRNIIGLLKAFGYGGTRIAWHYAGFALAAVFIGAVAGVPLGSWLGAKLAAVYRDFFRFPELRFVPGISLILAGIVISAAAACLGALGAVRKAASLSPAEAMRPETPPQFREGFAERLNLQRWLSITVRMILRNLQRRPGKALLSILGLSMAVAILVVGFYFYDAIQYLIRVEFQLAQRDDVSLAFTEPRGPTARHDLEHLPGVLRTETFRVVPARLRFEHRSRRIGILGLEAAGELRRLVNRDLKAVPLPPDGMLLSAKLAEILHVGRGDCVTVEILEGRRPVRNVIVSGLVDELIGVAAYMDVRQLNRLMQEDEMISGAYLAVDSSSLPRLYSLLKQTPAVSGVSVRGAMLESFQKTIAQSLRISTGALLTFACVIAIGMVYNGARIALSERGHELASLRVLGFSDREIGWMLLGEQGLLGLVSMPAGFAIGYSICALLTAVMQTELYRMPLVITSATYAYSFLVVAAAAVCTGMLIYRRLSRLDLVSVLKTRE